MVLTVMPSGPSSCDSVFAQPTTPGRMAFDSIRLGIGSRTDQEVMLTIRPRPLARRCGSASRASRTAEFSDSSKASAQASAGVDSKLPGGGPPALLTTMSSRPCRSTVPDDGALERRLVAHVAGRGRRPRHSGSSLLEPVWVARQHRHRTALGRQRTSDREPHPR